MIPPFPILPFSECVMVFDWTTGTLHPDDHDKMVSAIYCSKSDGRWRIKGHFDNRSWASRAGALRVIRKHFGL